MTSPSSLFTHLPLPSKSKPPTTLPPFLYGTAWKKDHTTPLVQTALQNTFTAIDTACQPRHYREDLVAAGIRQHLSSPNNKNKLTRSDIYIQTKYTSIGGQDPNNIPYNPKASLTEQVQQSVATSLRNFTVNNEQPYLDALILHSPMPTMGQTLEIWSALEQYVPDRIRHLGISNTDLQTLMALYDTARIKPSIVQNRFYADTKYDVAIRKFCGERGMAYQCFWTLSANPGLLRSEVVMDVARNLQIEPANALYCLVLGLGNTVVLNGTTSVEHMRGDWEGVRRVREFAEGDREGWEDVMRRFRGVIGERVD
ncbi:hypothetical protein OHC33_009295 [Knufia fluminis]|uniref:NADP-dependent oxidoreductase domain-containing protein n=1 Tax=Knufia fluminis TaxID=191047 RepID=A0AAN8EA51_9EURO|nr:hypothetical protein OHC33_009295 [Knufia fluminis]